MCLQALVRQQIPINFCQIIHCLKFKLRITDQCSGAAFCRIASEAV